MSEEVTAVAETMEKGTGRVYELGYHFVPTMDEETVIKEASALRAMIEAKGGTIVSEELPREFALAYEMEKDIANKKNKFTNSFFGWVKFEIDPSVAEAMNKELMRDDRIIRYLLIKTVKENTIASKRVSTRTEGGVKRKYVAKRDDEPQVEINKEEVDKKLDELLGAE